MASPVQECPQCGGKEIFEISQSPVAEKWVLFGCRFCNCAWRSTESSEDLAKIRRFKREDLEDLARI